jgi:ankyrin repeat protein
MSREHLTTLGGKIPEPGAAVVDEEMVQIERIRNLMKTSPDRVNLAVEMDTAVLNNWAKVLRFLLDSGAVPPAGLLDDAARRGQLACLNALLEVAKDQVAPQRGSALATAAAVGHVEIVKALLKAGADVNWLPEKSPKAFEADHNNYNRVVGTPLTTALRFDESAVVDLLLEAKPDIRLAAKPTGLTALHAALLHDEKYAERLLDRGADVNALASLGLRNKEGEPEIQSPLQIAAYRESWEIATLLVKRGANLSQPGLLAPFLTNYCEPKKRAGILRFLLDAGADPGPDPYPILALVAQVDEDGSRTTKLLTNPPAPPDLKKLPDMYQWQAKARQVFLATAVYPELVKLPGVKLFFADSGKWKVVHQPVAGQDPPTIGELLLANLPEIISLTNGENPGQSTNAFRSFKCRLLRPDDAGTYQETAATDANGPEQAVPQDRDLIEVFRDDRGNVGDSSRYREFVTLMTNALRTRVAFPVTVEIEGKARQLLLRGDRLVFDHTVAEAPLVNAGPLLRMLLPAAGGRNPNVATRAGVRIKRPGWADLTFELDSQELAGFALQRGDHLVLTGASTAESFARPSKAADDLVALTTVAGAVLIVPGQPFARIFGVDSPTNQTNDAVLLPTLLQAIADVYAWTPQQLDQPERLHTADEQTLQQLLTDEPPPVILPHPDFSNIRIRRLEPDGSESVVKVDLAAAITRCSDTTTAAEAREVDLELRPGDVVELPLKAPADAAPWTGFTPEQARFFRKALSVRLLVTRQGKVSQLDFAYEPPAWRATRFGLLPLPPAAGFATVRLSALQQLRHQEIQQSSNGFGSGSSGFSTTYSGRSIKRGSGPPWDIFGGFSTDRDPFLRDGDSVSDQSSGRRVQPGAPVVPETTRQPRPRVIPPPTPAPTRSGSTRDR